MRMGWEYKKLGDCTQILDSQRKPVTKKDRKSGIYPYYGATGIQDYVDKYIFDGRYVLVGEDGAKWSSFTQSAFIIEGKTWVNNHAHVLRTNDFLVDSFLVYFLNYSDLDSYISGAIIRKLTQASLRNIDIPLPPKSTQLAIVSELDKINELIRLKKEQLKDFDNLAQSLFYEMFGDPVENEKGWEVKKLGDVCTFSQGMQVPIENQKEIQNEGDVRFLRIIDFTQGKDAPRYVECDNDKYILHEKEIAIVRYGTPGFICTGKIGAIANNLFKLNPVSDNIFVFEYLVHWLSTDAFQLSIKGKQYGAALQAIKFSTIQNIEIILPPLSFQRLFAQRIEQIEREKTEVQKSIQDLETLLASRMQYWFE